MRIESIRFRNFKLLRDTTLPLEPLTVIVGPNGSGKSSVFEALSAAAHGDGDTLAAAQSTVVEGGPQPVEVEARMVDHGASAPYVARAQYVASARSWRVSTEITGPVEPGFARRAALFIQSFRAYRLAADQMRRSSALARAPELSPDGSNIPVVLDALRDRDEEQWTLLNRELRRWVPEFDRVQFDTTDDGQRAVALRMDNGGHSIAAAHLSSGTLYTLALLTILHAERERWLIGIEEPEVGLHPRLLRNVRDALFRMAYPRENGDDHPPRQVIVTTHSPYFLDLFRDHPDNVVVAERLGGPDGERATFHRLSDLPDIDEILSEAPLGEAWFSGILGGVPAAG